MKRSKGKMASRNHKGVYVDNGSKDYLQDPELWLDKLPQPFKMIDGVLQQFLDVVWEEIESREMTRSQEEAQVKVAELSDCLSVVGSEGVKLVGYVLCLSGTLHLLHIT